MIKDYACRPSENKRVVTYECPLIEDTFKSHPSCSVSKTIVQAVKEKNANIITYLLDNSSEECLTDHCNTEQLIPQLFNLMVWCDDAEFVKKLASARIMQIDNFEPTDLWRLDWLYVSSAPAQTRFVQRLVQNDRYESYLDKHYIEIILRLSKSYRWDLVERVLDKVSENQPFDFYKNLLMRSRNYHLNGFILTKSKGAQQMISHFTNAFKWDYHGYGSRRTLSKAQAWCVDYVHEMIERDWPTMLAALYFVVPKVRHYLIKNHPKVCKAIQNEVNIMHMGYELRKKGGYPDLIENLAKQLITVDEELGEEECRSFLKIGHDAYDIHQQMKHKAAMMAQKEQALADQNTWHFSDLLRGVKNGYNYLFNRQPAQKHELDESHKNNEQDQPKKKRRRKK